MVTYDSGADVHYLRKKDRTKLGLPILIISDKKVGVDNRGACNGKYVTSLPLPHISRKSAEADTLEELPTLLMSVGKTSEDGNVCIFTEYGVTIHK